MVRTKDENKRRAIRDAAIADTVERGLVGTSIARIATRAGVSQGTIYLYFPTKEALLQEAYLDVKRAFHERQMALARASASSEEAIRAMWMDLYAHALERPNDFAFTEYVAAAKLLDPQKQPEVDAMAEDIRGIVAAAVADGTLRDAPVQAILSVLTAPAIHLARRHVVQKQAVSKDVVEITFQAIWRGLALN